MIDSCKFLVYETLLQLTSSEEVCELIAFNDEYIEADPRLRNVMKRRINEKDGLIRDCMIGSVATIDLIIDTRTSLPQNAYCLEMLRKEMTNSMIDAATQDAVLMVLEAFPLADFLVSACALGWDCYKAIELAHKYHQCLATHIS